MSGARGVVKWFDCEKGFGSITPDDGRVALFVEHTGIECSNDRAFRDGQERWNSTRG
ncbi:cold shock domain-containing protein [Rhodococcus sp. C26F]